MELFVKIKIKKSKIYFFISDAISKNTLNFLLKQFNLLMEDKLKPNLLNNNSNFKFVFFNVLDLIFNIHIFHI